MSRILIVEDDEDIGAALQRELTKDGYDVIRAVTGTEGRMMLGQNPDLKNSLRIFRRRLR